MLVSNQSATGLLFVILLFTGLSNPTAIGQEPATAEWTQWRGNDRDGMTTGDWPQQLTKASLTTLWSQPLGKSYSGPIVSSGQVFTTETRDKSTEVVTAFDTQTGAQNWTVQWPGAMTVPFFAAKNGSWIRSTPATDGQRLYVAGILGRLVCLDNATGDKVWEVDFSQRYGVKNESFGQVCSPLIIDRDTAKDNAVYIQCNAGFLKLDRRTGEEIWRTLEEEEISMSSGAFSSPFVATVAGVPQILVQTRTELTGVDPDTGRVLWRQRVPNFRGMNILTPTVFGDTVFTSSYNHRSFAFEVSKSGDSLAVAEKWTARPKAYMSSPVIVGEHVYLHLQNKRLACLNLKTGDAAWKTKERFGDYMSMIANGNQILALDSRGILYLINATPEKLDVVGKVKLATNDSWAHLAIVDNQIFVRGINSLTAYQWSE